MKKLLSSILISLLLLINAPIGHCALEGSAAYNYELRDIQTKTYNLPQSVVKKAIFNLLEKEDYQVSFIDDDYNYLIANKNTKVKSTSYPYIFVNLLRFAWDTVGTILSAGIRSYTLVNDIIIIRHELKDKDLEKILAINITKNNNSSTTIRINMRDIMMGKRDFLPVGPKNRIKTTNIKEESTYENFFSTLDKELQS